MDIFDWHYGHLITGGTYHNQTTGPMDLLGINFYSQEQAAYILEQLQLERPPDYQTLENWLRKGQHYIGFYGLGV